MYEEIQFWKTPYKWICQYAVDNKVIKKLIFPKDLGIEDVRAKLQKDYPNAVLHEMF